MQALPIILSEVSCVLVGPHGCGKTLSSLVPLLTRVMMQEIALPWDESEGPFAVVCTTDALK